MLPGTSRLARGWATIGLSVVCTMAALQTPARAADTPTMSLTGVLHTPTGQPIAGALISVSVEPPAAQLIGLPDGSEVYPVEIGYGSTAADGRFSAWLSDPSTMSAYRDEDGLIALVLTAPTDAGQVFYRSRVTLGADSVVRPFADDVAADADPVDRQASLSALGVTTDGRPKFDLVATQFTPTQDVPTATVAAGRDCPAGFICGTGSDDVRVVPSRTDRPDYDAAVAASNAQVSSSGKTFDPDVWCGGNYWFLRKSKDIVGRNLTMADQLTGGHTTATFGYTTSKNTTVEIGVTNRVNDLVATLGMSKGSTVSASIKGTISKNTRAEWWISYNFNLYDVMCTSNTTYQTWWSGYTEYRPKGFSGNSSRRTWVPFACNSSYKNTLGPNTEISVAKDKTTTRSGAFGVGDATNGNLKVSQTWNTSVAMGYAGDSAGFNICGYNGRWYTGVTKTREVA